MLSIEDEDNPLAALIKKADEEGMKNNDEGDPIIVFSGANENDEDDNQDNGPITLSIRQPSFSHLTSGKLVPKGGNESISKSNKNFKFKKNGAISKEKHSSSYANLQIIIDPSLKKEISGMGNSQLVPDVENNSNPILVITGNDDAEDDDEKNTPIGLSVRQPSFASLCNHIIPKGGLETGEMSILIEEEPKKSEDSNQNEETVEDNLAPILGLQVRQSSYANLRLNTPQKEEVTDLMKLAIKEDDSQQNKNTNETKSSISANSSNPIIVLTGNDDDNDEDDENNAPIGLSVRQPSFASLCNHIIPKGGLETGDMPIVIEEEWPGEEDKNENQKDIENENENENEPMVLNVRQSSYANLHFGNQPSNQIPQIETIPDEEIEQKENKKEESIEPTKESEDAIIVLTNDDEEKDDGAPIGLSVRQPSFASLTGNVIPKGGFQSIVPTITEECDEKTVLDQEISDVDIDSSSETENVSVYQNQYNESNENKEDNKLINNDEVKKEPAIKDKILSSLLSINKQWWEEIGYKPSNNSSFQRSSSMFQVPTSKEFKKNSFGSSNSNEADLSSKNSNPSMATVKRSSHSLYQGQLNKINDLLKDDDSTKTSSRKGNLTNEKRGPSIYRVNSYGNKTELIEVEMPILREINVEEDVEENEEENEFLNNSRYFMVNDSNVSDNTNEISLIAESQLEEPTTKSTKSSEQGIKISRGPSMQRVNSFGNASTLKVVEMPTITEENQSKNKNQNKNQIQSNEEEEEEEEEADDKEEEEEYEEEDNSNIPPEILKMMEKPRDPIVYSALCGASINGYKRETVHKALTDLKSMNKKCQENELDIESEFLTRVIEGIRQDAAQDDPYFEVEEQMRDTEIELQGKLADWQNMYEELDDEYKLQVEECEQRYQEELLSIEKQFHTTTAAAKNDSNQRPNSDSIINRKIENDEKIESVNKTTENGITIIDNNSKYIENKKRSNVSAKSPSNRKRHSSLTPNSATILSPSISGKPFQPQKPQQRSKAAVYSSTSPKPQLFQSVSPVVSPEAIKMKEKVQKMIKAQRFEESFELSLKYYKRQMTEHQKQVNKRSQAFIAAKTALKQKHEDERKEIENNFRAKRAEFTKKREQSLVPLRQQIIQLRKLKNLIEEGEKNEKINETMQSRLRASRTNKRKTALPPLSQNSSV